jgi:hypothetical protein
VDSQKPTYTKPENTWVLTAYYGISVWYILDGFRIGAAALAAAAKEGLDVISVIIAVLNIVIGLGLLLRIEVIRSIVVFFAALNILFGIFSLVGSILGTMMFGWLSFVFTIWICISILLNMLMIYLVGETDRRAPNL